MRPGEGVLLRKKEQGLFSWEWGCAAGPHDLQLPAAAGLSRIEAFEVERLDPKTLF
jgi:hypothetical protein